MPETAKRDENTFTYVFDAYDSHDRELARKERERWERQHRRFLSTQKKKSLPNSFISDDDAVDSGYPYRHGMVVGTKYAEISMSENTIYGSRTCGVNMNIARKGSMPGDAFQAFTWNKERRVLILPKDVEAVNGLLSGCDSMTVNDYIGHAWTDFSGSLFSNLLPLASILQKQYGLKHVIVYSDSM